MQALYQLSASAAPQAFQSPGQPASVAAMKQFMQSGVSPVLLQQIQVAQQQQQQFVAASAAAAAAAAAAAHQPSALLTAPVVGAGCESEKQQQQEEKLAREQYDLQVQMQQMAAVAGIGPQLPPQPPVTVC
ncbi:unnamed protein product [Gongylonema pulchrum]|uniref:Polyhomeotic-like protein 2 n=1 Tax=Gongylonema pulchrum TaxID=637853 RepID=A0A183DRC4_9BILA|nr:unnamed protein product [Gongylonema pulchrum]